MEVLRRRLMSGVYLTYIQERKFKTNVLSAQLIAPLEKKTAAANALLPAVLRRGTARYPDMQTLSAVLDGYYGARVSCTVRKKGENQCVGFVASFVDDHFIPGGEKLLEGVAELLGDLFCNPATRSGRFVPDYVQGERTNLIDQIRGQINDKRVYASARLMEEMCGGEPYGISRLGGEKEAEKLTPAKLHKRYAALLSTARLELFYCGSAPVQRVEQALLSLGGEKEAEKLTPAKLHKRYAALLSTARLELFYCGSAPVQRVEQALLSAFRDLPRAELAPPAATMPHPAAAEVRRVTECMDVTQGKLSMGFSCTSPDYPALLLFNMIYGGSATSKLFLNVREKESLCYYASSVLHRQKNLITLSSGIEVADYQRAYDEILAQLDKARRGEIEDWEEEGARSTIRHAFRAMGDSLGQMEDFYLGRAATGSEDTIEGLAADLESVTRERMLAAAEGIALDTVYFLKNYEKEEVNEG